MLVPASMKLWLCALSVALRPHHFPKARDSHTTSGRGSSHEKGAGDNKCPVQGRPPCPWDLGLVRLPHSPWPPSFETGVETRWESK